MTTTKKAGPRGRPRRFDPNDGVATAQQIFHAHGYDAVSVADVTEALGINPPSFYAAFGNKGGLYRRVIDRYVDTNAIPLRAILRPDRPVAEALAEALAEAARLYAINPAAPGCLVLEGLRSNDPAAREAACSSYRVSEAVIRDYIADRHPDDAQRATDFVSTVMAGLSAKARSGHGLEQLLETSRIAGLALEQILHSTR